MSRALKLSTAVLLFTVALASAAEHWTKPYNIVWTEPATNAFASMPIGGGNVGLNVWTEKDALLFYIGSSDSWTEGQALAKLGRLRLKISPNPFGKNLRQELDLASNSILVSGESEDGNKVSLRVWVDVFRPVVHVEGDSTAPVSTTAAVECWRNEEARHDGNAVEWYRRNNPAHNARAKEIERQHLEKIADLICDPLTNRCFGGRMSGAGMIPDGTSCGTNGITAFRAFCLKTGAPTNHFDIRATLRIAQDATVEQWQAELDRLATATGDTAADDHRKTLEWWQGFWSRSWIVIDGSNQQPTTNNQQRSLPWQAGRNYQLFRAMLGANRNGQFPTLFNGGPFLCGWNPDSRMWANCWFMGQNQRLVYWPMLKSGDDDLLKICLDFYAGHAKLQQARAKLLWNIDGAIFPELMSVFGLDGAPDKEGRSNYGHLKYHYTTCIEFALMMLEYARYSGADVRPYLPVPESIIHYYDQFCRDTNKARTGSELDAGGQLVIEPSSALEHYTNARNNTDVIAGLMAVTDALLAMSDAVLSAERKEFYRQFRSRLPPFPIRQMRGHKVISPAEKWEKVSNPTEFPVMYSVFPFGIYGLGRPDVELARDTWWYGYDSACERRDFCWYQSLMFTARLGLTYEAAERAVAKFRNTTGSQPDKPARTRYPAFWDNPGFDELPDMDHGGSAMVGLQEMLLQADGKKILLFPAWPREWDVDFKLHAPYQTTVEAIFRKGKIEKLVVTPSSRAADVVDLSGVEPPVAPVQLLPKDGLCVGKQSTASSIHSPDYGPERAIDGDSRTRWAAKLGTTNAWLEVDLGKPTLLGRALISEIEWPEVREFVIEVKEGDGWKEVVRGTSVGENRMFEFSPIRAQIVRLRIIKSELATNVNEFQLYPPATQKEK